MKRKIKADLSRQLSHIIGRFSLIAMLGIGAFGMTACGGLGSNKTNDEISSNELISKEETDSKENPAENEETTLSDKVASGDETIEAQDIVSPDMVPVSADKIKNGEYSINVDSSSSMFKITECKLKVEEDTMTATLTMSGTAYTKLYLGTGSQAVAADESSYVSYEENENGEYTFTIPVEALDKGIDCSAYSKNKEKWYDRILVFRADSLPIDALEESGILTATELNLADGTYTVNVKLSGGSGKASVESPATIKVESGKVTATIIFSSSNYDYMLVNGEMYETVNTEGNSTFEIPIAGFDVNLPVVADTTAMSQPYEIDYTLHFDSKTIK